MRAMRFRDLGKGTCRKRLVDLVRVEVVKGDVQGLYVWVKRDFDVSLSQYQRAMPFRTLAAMSKGELAVVFDPLCVSCQSYGCHGCHEALRQRMAYCQVCYSKKWNSYEPRFDKKFME